MTHQFPDVVENVLSALKVQESVLPAGFIIDAELVAVRKSGFGKSATNSNNKKCTKDVGVDREVEEGQNEPLLLPFQLLSTRNRKAVDDKARDSPGVLDSASRVFNDGVTNRPISSYKLSHFFGKEPKLDALNQTVQESSFTEGWAMKSHEADKATAQDFAEHHSGNAEQDNPQQFQVCVFVFDVLMWNSRSLLETALRERRDVLTRSFGRIPCKFEFAKTVTIEVKPELVTTERIAVGDAVQPTLKSLLSQQIGAFMQESIESGCEGCTCFCFICGYHVFVVLSSLTASCLFLFLPCRVLSLSCGCPCVSCLVSVLLFVPCPYCHVFLVVFACVYGFVFVLPFVVFVRAYGKSRQLPVRAQQTK